MTSDKSGNNRTSDAFDPLVRRYVDAPSPGLRIDLGLLRLLDRAYCQSLEQDLRNFASPWEVRAATDQLAEMLPDAPGIYMFVWRPPFTFCLADGGVSAGPFHILYVGQAGGEKSSSGTLRGRYKGYRKHLSGDPEALWVDGTIPDRRDALLARYLTLRPLEYWFSIIEDKRRISLLEDRLIKLLNPPLNTNQGPKLRPHSAKPAFSSGI